MLRSPSPLEHEDPGKGDPEVIFEYGVNDGVQGGVNVASQVIN